MRSSVSLIIPFYNRETLLPRTLRSVAESSLFPAHVVLVDNGSTDGSLEICREWSRKQDMRVTIVQEPMAGAAAARNRGLREVDTPWVFFFDSDDLLDPDFFADIQPRLTAALDFVAVPTRMRVNGKERVRRYFPTDDAAHQILCGHLNTQAMVFSTAFVRKIGGWDARCMIWNDWELGLRTLLGKPRMLWFTPKAYHTIGIHSESITGDGYRGKAGRLLNTLRIAADDIRKMSGPVDRKRLMKALCFRHALLCGRLQKEGDAAGACECLGQRRAIFGDVPAVVRSEAWIIRTLTACHVPGTWRLALTMV